MQRWINSNENRSHRDELFPFALLESSIQASVIGMNGSLTKMILGIHPFQ